MEPRLDSSRRVAWLRWLPPVGLTVCVVAICLVPSFLRLFLYYRGAASLVILVMWSVSAWIVSIAAHEQFVRNLRMVKPKQMLIVGAVVAGLLFLQNAVSPSFLPLFLLLMHVSLAADRPRLRLAASLLTAMFTIVLVEGLFALPLSMPTLWDVPGLRAIALNRYWSEIDLIQWNPACAQWDPELAYTLRPGRCTYSNPGYSTEYRINELGVRDDEESLEQPDIVALGDSHSMGMGVEQDETYASQLERMLNLKVLNAGISSYGTPRELGILQRIDRSRARHLLIQYCSNDFDENREFIDNGGKLPARSRDWFATQVESQESTRRYYPGKFTDALLWLVAGRLHVPGTGNLQSAADQSNQALKYFLDVIERHPADLSGMRIIIFQMESANDLEGNALRLEQLPSEFFQNSRLNGAQFLDVMTGLGPEHFLPLDGHMNSLGHRRVAERLAAIIRQ